MRKTVEINCFLCDKKFIHTPMSVGRLKKHKHFCSKKCRYNYMGNLLKNNKYSEKYCVNDKYFEKINSPEKAYWLGFIVADGNVCKNSLQIRLHIQDKGHLKKIRKCLNSSHPIKTIIDKDNYEYSSLCISNKKICNDLSKYGVVPNKSLICNPNMDLIPRKLHRDFWRGMIDGDGSIGINKPNKSPSPIIQLVGSHSVCEKFLNYLKTLIKTNAKVHHHKNIYSCVVGSFYVNDFLRILYYDNCMCLDRKKKTTEKVLLLKRTRKIYELIY